MANDTLFGRTDTTGIVSACGLLGPGYYIVEAYSWGTPYGSTTMEVHRNGTGVVVIEKPKPTIIYSVPVDWVSRLKKPTH